jgi:hypothetical protein
MRARGLIFLARKCEAATGSILHTEPRHFSQGWAEVTAEICAGGQSVLPDKHVNELFISETRKIFAAIVKWLRQKKLTQLQREITVNSLSWQDCLSSKGCCFVLAALKENTALDFCYFSSRKSRAKEN